MTKLDAITHINNALENNPKFKKDFRGYIELSLIEELEASKIKLPIAKESEFVKNAANHILRLFDPTWFELAFDLNKKK